MEHGGRDRQTSNCASVLARVCWDGLSSGRFTARGAGDAETVRSEATRGKLLQSARLDTLLSTRCLLSNYLSARPGEKASIPPLSCSLLPSAERRTDELILACRTPGYLASSGRPQAINCMQQKTPCTPSPNRAMRGRPATELQARAYPMAAFSRLMSDDSIALIHPPERKKAHSFSHSHRAQDQSISIRSQVGSQPPVIV